MFFLSLNFAWILAETPTAKDLLAENETIITPYYMSQLLKYGINLGQSQDTDASPEALLKEAEVRVGACLCYSLLTTLFTAPRRRTQINPKHATVNLVFVLSAAIFPRRYSLVHSF